MWREKWSEKVDEISRKSGLLNGLKKLTDKFGENVTK